MPKIILVITLFLATSYSDAQVKKNNIVSISTGYNNATISAGMNGFFVQASIARKIIKPISLRFSLGFAKSSGFPKNFNYELAPFKIEDLTLYPFATNNLDLWNLVKDRSVYDITPFGFTEATNIYCSLNTDIKVFKIKKFSFNTTIGINYINTFGTQLYLKTLTFSNSKLVAFTPTATYNSQRLLGFNTGIKLEYELKKHFNASLIIDKYFGEDGRSFSQSEWINLGVGISKTF